MKTLWMILGLLLVGGVGTWLYVGVQHFQPAKILDRQSEKVDQNIETAKKNLDQQKMRWQALIDSGKQLLQSWVDAAIASGEALYQQKKKEAELYMQQQKVKLEAEAKARVQAEAKKQIDNVFNWK